MHRLSPNHQNWWQSFHRSFFLSPGCQRPPVCPHLALGSAGGRLIKKDERDQRLIEMGLLARIPTPPTQRHSCGWGRDAGWLWSVKRESRIQDYLDVSRLSRVGTKMGQGVGSKEEVGKFGWCWGVLAEKHEMKKLSTAQRRFILPKRKQNEALPALLVYRGCPNIGTPQRMRRRMKNMSNLLWQIAQEVERKYGECEEKVVRCTTSIEKNM